MEEPQLIGAPIGYWGHPQTEQGRNLLAVMGDNELHRSLIIVFEEVEFLYTRGILAEKKLGRTQDIIVQARLTVYKAAK